MEFLNMQPSSASRHPKFGWMDGRTDANRVTEKALEIRFRIV
jgi:hypothetical protein